MFRGLLPIDSLEYGDALATPHDLARPTASMHPSDMAMLPQRPMASSIATSPDVPHRRMKRDVVAEDVDRMRHQAFEYAQNTLPVLDGDMIMLLIAVVVTIGATAIADSIRHSNADIPTIVDWIALSCAIIIDLGFAVRSIWRLWADLRLEEAVLAGFNTRLERRRPQLGRTLLDVMASYMLTLVAFGVIFASVGIVEGQRHISFIPGDKPNLTMRVIDGIYVMTFVAAGIGFPHPDQPASRYDVGSRVVAWACSLLTTTFVGNVLIATALTVRMSPETLRQELPV